jgi:hypothetical protein
MEIVNDERLISQICAVTGDLQAASTPQGHGDSYWSIALVAKGVIDRIGYSDSDFSSPIRQKVATGSKSLFTEGAAIPRNW